MTTNGPLIAAVQLIRNGSVNTVAKPSLSLDEPRLMSLFLVDSKVVLDFLCVITFYPIPNRYHRIATKIFLLVE